nr:MAG TPA: hypothetical protein [Caudoviricetes sp.]
MNLFDKFFIIYFSGLWFIAIVPSFLFFQFFI